VRRLGIVGYYGHGNFGDELFLNVFRRLFPMSQYRLDLLGHSGALMRQYPDSRLQTLKEDYAAILIGGGDLLIPGYDIAEQYLLPEYTQVPVFIHGVGVPTWTGTDEKAIAKMRSFVQSEAIQWICARDPESAEWINSTLKPQVSAIHSEDMVFSLADTLESDYTPKRPIETVGIVMRGGQATPKCKMKTFVRSLLNSGLKVKFLMLATGAELTYDYGAVEELECLDSPLVDVVVRQSDSDLLHAFGGVDAVYSMKFHGCIAALMHGIPTVALITTDKFVHLYKKLELEKFVIHHTNEKLFDSIEQFADFPKLGLNDLYESSADSLRQLKRRIDGLK